MKTFYLVDYKGKATVIQDELFELDIEVGTITKDQAIEESPMRKEDAEYYGIPAYIGDDKDLLRLYD